MNRFWDKVDKRGLDECWNWKGGLTAAGYGRMMINGKRYYAHRISHKLYYGDFGDAFVLHHCDNPQCVNPLHLYLGTESDNLRDAYNRGQKRPTKGERNGRALLRNYDVVGIRALYRQGRFTQRQLADRWGVSPGTVGCIVRYETWTHI